MSAEAPDALVKNEPVPDSHLRSIAMATPFARIRSMCLELVEARRRIAIKDLQLARADQILLKIDMLNSGFTGDNLEALRAHLRERGVIA